MASSIVASLASSSSARTVMLPAASAGPELASPSPALLLVRADELGAREDVALHGLFQPCPGRGAQVAELDVERVQLVKVAVAADRRTGAAVVRALPVVQPCAGPGRRVVGAAFGQP